MEVFLVSVFLPCRRFRIKVSAFSNTHKHSDSGWHHAVLLSAYSSSDRGVPPPPPPHPPRSRPPLPPDCFLLGLCGLHLSAIIGPSNPWTAPLSTNGPHMLVIFPAHQSTGSESGLPFVSPLMLICLLWRTRFPSRCQEAQVQGRSNSPNEVGREGDRFSSTHTIWAKFITETKMKIWHWNTAYIYYFNTHWVLGLNQMLCV